MRTVLFTFLIGTFAAACGGGHDVDPSLITGGGIADPGIDGEVNIYVIDDTTDSPIQGAMVHVGDTIEGTTDATGLFVASAGSLSGPQIITAMATNYATSTWFGADGANVTINLTPDSSTASVPQATLHGTIAGWDAMTPPANQALIAMVQYSANDNQGDAANNLSQPGNPPGNVCIKVSGTSTACDWSLVTRTGAQTVYALIGHAVLSAPPIAVTFTDFAYVSDIAVVDGVDQNGITLAKAAAGSIETASVSIPSAPTGTDTTGAIARLDVGTDGILQIPLGGDLFGGQVTFAQVVVPKTSLFAGSTLDLMGVATHSTNKQAQSLRIDHDASTTVGASLTAFPALPTSVATATGTFSFTPAASGTVDILQVEDADKVRVWEAVLLDGSTSVTLPAAVTLPTGTLTYRAQSVEVPGVDLQDFDIPSVQDAMTGMSADGVTFTN